MGGDPIVRYLPPIPWHAVAPGTVVLIDGEPRTVCANWENLGICLVLLEGDPDSHYFRCDDSAQPVELDDTDAIGNMLRAGLTLKEII